jgi:hypothetical protein
MQSTKSCVLIMAVCDDLSYFSQAWRHAKHGRPKMSAKLLRVLGQQRPDLAAVSERSVSCIQRQLQSETAELHHHFSFERLSQTSARRVFKGFE